MTVKYSDPKTMPHLCRLFADRRSDQGEDRADRRSGATRHGRTSLVGAGDFAAQVEQVFKNVDAAVRAAGGAMKDLVKINNYVRGVGPRPEQIRAFRDVRDRYVNTAAPPVSTLIYVSRLAQPGWLFEMDAMAVIDG